MASFVKIYHPYLDLLKFLCCIGIISIHINPFSKCELANYYFSHLANIYIAIFFVVSSCLFWWKIRWNNSDYNVLWKFTYRLLILLFVWGGILAWHWGILYYHEYQEHGGTNFLLSLLLRLTTSGTCLGAWFIVSLIYTTWILYFLNRYLNKHMVFILVTTIWLYHSMVYYENMNDCLNIFWRGEYYQGKGIHSAFLPPRAIFWIESGFYLIPYLQKLITSRRNIIITVCIIALCFLGPFLKHYYFVTNAVISILTPMLLLKVCSTKSHPKLVTLRNMSIIVYFVHRPICTAFEFLNKHGYIAEKNGWLLFLTTVILSCLTAYIIVETSKNLKILKYCY